MGATTLAFLPFRYALVTEGASDIILLPVLLREAINKDYLGFQIVPGISEADEKRIGLIEKEAPRTVYLTDADEGGKRLAKQLRSAGIVATRILELPRKGTVIEDFIDKQLYVDSLNEELRRSFGIQDGFPLAHLPETNRPAAVAQWCKTKGIKNPPNKRAVAYRIIEAKSAEAKEVSAKKYRSQLKSLYELIARELQLPES